MLNFIYENLDNLFGLSNNILTLYHMIYRVSIVYIFGIIVLNFVNKRFIGEKTPFDIILRFIIGSSLANAITGSSPFFATLGMVFFIIILNYILSLITLYSDFADKLLKGRAIILFQKNHFDLTQMRRYHFSKEDLLSEIRKLIGSDNLTNIKTIMLENSGEISVILKEDSKKIHTNNHNSQDDDD